MKIFKLALLLSTIFLTNCKNNTDQKTDPVKEQLNNEINFDKILKCSDYSYMENYFITADYGCIYTPENNNNLGNIIIYLIPKTLDSNSIELEKKINNFSEENLKEKFNIYIYLIRKDFLNPNPNGDPTYYQNEKFEEELYTFNVESEKWSLIDSIQINNYKENLKEQQWRDNFINSKINQNNIISSTIDSYSLPSNMFIYDSIKAYSNQNEYNILVLEKESLKNKDNVQHNSNQIVILQKKEKDFIKIKENNRLVFQFNDNCPADGYGRLVAKNEYFTIEQSFCSDFMFVNSYTTFRFLNDEIFLHKYSQEYSDRNNPDKDISNKTWTIKDFGEVKFEDVSEDFLISVIQNEPKI
ncbi:hypothetical protein [Flavobacterium sp.]|uniref:hypothetical protein n=1 Tax=Flavobacterium sp. TaxID=239 RepID=UPI0040482C3B